MKYQWTFSGWSLKLLHLEGLKFSLTVVLMPAKSAKCCTVSFKNLTFDFTTQHEGFVYTPLPSHGLSDCSGLPHATRPGLDTMGLRWSELLCLCEPHRRWYKSPPNSVFQSPLSPRVLLSSFVIIEEWILPIPPLGRLLWTPFKYPSPVRLHSERGMWSHVWS